MSHARRPALQVPACASQVRAPAHLACDAHMTFRETVLGRMWPMGEGRGLMRESEGAIRVGAWLDARKRRRHWGRGVA